MGSCRIPVTGHIIIDSEGKTKNQEYEYASIDPRSLADLLLRGFGIDMEDLADNNTTT